MRLHRQFLSLLGNLILILTAACAPAVASMSLPPESSTPPQVGSSPATPTASDDCPDSASQDGKCAPAFLLSPSTTPEPPSGSQVPQRTPTTSLSSISPTPTLTTSLPPTSCPQDLCTYTSQFFLERPIALPGNDEVDVTYRFGSTQGGRRDPHHGVEFLNPFGTAVLAAGDGVVVVAGDDRKPTSEQGSWPITFYGPYSYFYGNLVVIEHQAPKDLQQTFSDLPIPIYTLYAHLSEISVEEGQLVSTGQEIGKVGMTGVAEGSHLHFEVRLGENTYQSSRNPELWLRPHLDENGKPRGGIAVRVLNAQGKGMQVSSIVLEHLPESPEKPKDFEIYLSSYEEEALIGQLPWEESFAVGDIPPGWYQLSFVYFGVQKTLVQVFPGQLTMMTFREE